MAGYTEGHWVHLGKKQQLLIGLFQILCDFPLFFPPSVTESMTNALRNAHRDEISANMLPHSCTDNVAFHDRKNTQNSEIEP